MSFRMNMKNMNPENNHKFPNQTIQSVKTLKMTSNDLESIEKQTFQIRNAEVREEREKSWLEFFLETRRLERTLKMPFPKSALEIWKNEGKPKGYNPSKEIQ